MAYLDEDEKLLGQGNQSTGTAASSQSPLVGSSGSDVGTGVSTAGVGAGGQGGWTNIQAYLNANKDNQNATPNALNSQYGSVFDEEESKLNADSSSVKTQAQSEAQKLTGKQDQLESYVNRAARTGDDNERTGIVDEVKGYLNNQYSGPQSYAYGLGAKTQDYGTQITGDRTALLNNVYKNAAGGQITQGQLALQNQLDVNNTGVDDARAALAARYSGLQNLANKTTEDTNKAITDAKSAYGTSQTGLKDELNRMADTYGSTKYGNADKYNAIQQFLGTGATFNGTVRGGDQINPDDVENRVKPPPTAEELARQRRNDRVV